MGIMGILHKCRATEKTASENMQLVKSYGQNKCSPKYWPSSETVVLKIPFVLFGKPHYQHSIPLYSMHTVSNMFSFAIHSFCFSLK